ncbi:helix-turn-helix transcriptional regulator [Herminiimonas sp. NPDC097707]|uniref:helix-turn-helix transcriptional regulator n=1 Tax=Herminiimonas sp. NPDC097707 TaxID=3364007 RepID=UPI00383B1473
MKVNANTCKPSRKGENMNELMGSKQLAKYLGVSMRTLDTLDKKGELPSGFRVGHLRRWRLEDVENWVNMRLEKCPVATQH